MISILLNLLPIAFILTAAFLSIYLFQVIQEEKRVPQRYTRKSPRRTKRVKRQPMGNSALRQRLSILLNGDARTAQRLVNQACVRHPERSVDWCVEKVIWDLERDRL